MSLKRFASTFLGVCFVLIGWCVAATGVQAATGDVLIRVTREDRQPFVGATVEINCTGWGTISSVTDGSGSILVDPITVSGAGCVSGSNISFRVSSSTIVTQTYPVISTDYMFYSDINPENSATYHDGATNRYVFGVETGTYTVQYWNMAGDPGGLPFPVTPADAMTTAPLVSFLGDPDASPYAGIAGNNWVASYQRTFTADTGWYEFTGSADDGIRVLIDGSIIPLNNEVGEGGWRAQGFGTRYTAKQYLTAGTHTVEVQYYQAGGGEQLEFRFYPIEALSPVAVISRPILSQLNSRIASPTIGVDVTSAMSYVVSGSCSGSGTISRGVSNISLAFVGDPLGAHADCQIEFTDVFGAHTTVSIPVFTVTASPVHVVSTCEQLQTIGQNPNTYQDTISLSAVDNHIDCTGVPFPPLRFGGERSFSGVLEGNNHRITGLEITAVSAGLIESINGGTVRNLTLGAGHVSGLANAGGLTGYAVNAVFTNIHSELTISSSGVSGGIVGNVEMGDAPGVPITWSDLSVAGSVTGTDDVGGLIGFLVTYGNATNFTLSTSTYVGSLGDGGNMSRAGGIIGFLLSYDGGDTTTTAVLNNLSASTTISCNDGYRCGGLVGYFEAGDAGGMTETTIQNSSSTGRIIANWGSAGGLFGAINLYESGSNVFLTVTNTQAYMDVQVSDGGGAGGAVGWFNLINSSDSVTVQATFSNIFASGTVLGTGSDGGLFGTTSGDGGPGIFLQTNSYGGLLIDSCEFRGTVSSESTNIGGLVGVMEGYSLNEAVPYLFTIQQSKALATVQGSNSIGGIAGAAYGTVLIQDSYSLSSATGTSSVGGVVGYQAYNAMVRRTYSAGHVASLDGHEGGLTGYFDGAVLENSYAASSVSADGGGVIGEFISGSVTNVYYDQQRAGTINCTSTGVLEGGCTAVNTLAEPDDLYFYNTFSNAPFDTWDFTNVWQVRALNHPALRHGYHAPLVNEDIPMLGDGTESNPYQITNCTQLQRISDDVSAFYRIENDLDCSETATWNDGRGFVPIGIESGTFSGHLDGAHHTIYDLTMHRPSLDTYVGLFSIVEDGSVENVNISRPIITSDATEPSMFSGIGVVAGAAADQIFRGIHVTGAYVSGHLPVGGIAGFSLNFGDPNDIAYEDRGIAYSSIEDSILTATGTYGVVGGLAGALYGAGIHDSYARADVNGEAGAGGVVGFMTNSTVERVYAFGSVVSSLGETPFSFPGVGGLVGSGASSLITSSFAVLPVTGSGAVGGVIGNGEGITMYNVSFDQTATTQSACGGPAFVPPLNCTAVNTDGSDNSHFYSTTVAAPFSISAEPIWDFDRVWFVSEGAPLLRSFNAPPHIPANPRVAGDSYTTTNFAWDVTSSTNEGEIQGYLVEYTGGALDGWQRVEVASTTTSYSFAPGTFDRLTAYQFRVRAYQAGPMGSALYGFATEPVELTTSDASYPTTTWTASSTNSWDDAANWSNGLPTSSTDVVIPYIGPGYHPYLWSAVTVHSLTIQEGAEVFLSGHNLTIAGGAFVNAGTFVLQGSETLTGLTQDVTQGTWMYTGVEGGPPATYTIRDFGAADYFNLSLTSFTGNDTFQLEDNLKLNGSLTLNSGLLNAHGFDNESTHEPGLLAEYSYTTAFNNGVTSTVDALINFEDTTVNGMQYLQSETFSARWEGQVLADYGEEYTFCTYSDDGARLWVNGTLLVDTWTEHGYEMHCGSIALEAGSWNTLRLEYNQYGGPGALRLTYSAPSQGEITVPASHLRHGVFVPYTIEVTRDWVNPGAGRFDAFGSTVRFVGGMQTIYGTATFYNVEKIATDTAGLLFNAYSYMGVLHQITLHGVTDHLLQIRRDEPSDPELPPWFMDWTNAIVDIENVAVRNAVNFGDHMIVVRDTTSTDLGNNYGWQINKTTPPEIIYDGVDVGTTAADVYWNSVDRLDASSTILYGTTTAYGMSQTRFSSNRFELTDLIPSATYHYKIAVTDASGNYGEGEDDTFTMHGDVSAPDISDILTFSHATSVRITWSTSEPADGRAAYSVNRSYASSTAVVDSSPLTTEHEITIDDLIPCAQYRVRIISTDEALNTATSTEQTVLTLGCPGNATRYGSEAEEFDLSEESSIISELDRRVFRVTAPAHFVAAEDGVVVLLRSMGSGESLASLGLPADGLQSVGPFTYDVKAIAGPGRVVGAFDQPVTISFQYLDSDITGLDAASLRLYHFHDGVWSMLNDCVNNRETHTIVCTAPHFSLFGLFGRSAAVSHVVPSGGGGGGSAGTSVISVYGCMDKRAKNYNPHATNQAHIDECVYATQSSVPLPDIRQPFVSTTIAVPTTPVERPTTCSSSLVPTSAISLRGKNRKQDVMQLQRFFNAYEGARLPVDGVYSLPMQQAVMAWQEKNKAIVLTPFGLKKATGNVLNASLALLKKQELVRCAPTERINTPPPGPPYLFTRTLKVGDKGEDVRQLQRYLNGHGYKVASQGAGSPGNETLTFGPGLLSALKKFQQDHADVVLKPFKLRKPTGIFESATRALVNQSP